MSRLLVIPDLHQDLNFLSRILDREDLSSFDQVVLLGDYFDARSELFATKAATRLTAQFLLELVKSYPKKVRLLWGNHDIVYCRFREFVLREDPAVIMKKAQMLDIGEVFQRALWINEVWPGEMWFRLELAMEEDGWLLSHAGIHPQFWPTVGTPALALQTLLMEWEGVIGNLFENEDHPLLEAGEARGGSQAVGGPLWCDWEREFVDELPYRQLVGHSAGAEPRQTGRSWCIDCAQRVYGLIEGGELRLVDLDE